MSGPGWGGPPPGFDANMYQNMQGYAQQAGGYAYQGGQAVYGAAQGVYQAGAPMFQQAEQAVEGAAGAAMSMGGQIGNYADAAFQNAQAAANQTGQVIQNAGGQMMGGMQHAYSASGQVMGHVTHEVAGGAMAAAHMAGSYGHQAAGAAQMYGSQAVQGAAQVAGSVGHVMGDAGQQVAGFAHDAGGAVVGAAGVAGAAVAGAAGDASQAVQSFSHEAAAVISQAGTLVAPTAAAAVAAAGHVADEGRVVVTHVAGAAGAWGSGAVEFSAAALHDAGKLTADVAGKTLSEIRNLAAEAPQYTSMALAAANAAKEKISDAGGEVLREGVAAAGTVAAAGAAFVAAHRQEAVAFAAAGFTYLHAGLEATKAMVPWGELQEVYTTSSKDILAAAAVVAGAAHQAFDWVKFDVVRDFFQTIALFFASIASAAIIQAKVVWGNISNAISINWNFITPVIPPQVIYAGLGVVGFVSIIIFIYFWRVALRETTDEIREGNEAKTWVQKKKEKPGLVSFLKYTLVVLLSAYLPVSRVAVQILACETSMAKTIKSIGAPVPCTFANTTVTNLPSEFSNYETCDCKAWKEYGILAALAVLMLAIYTVAFPIVCFKIIKRNIPIGSTTDPDRRFNADGVMVEYTDRMYLHDLSNDPRQLANPFLMLYNGYERRWAYYKVLQMVFKLVVVIPVIVLWNNIVLQTIITLVILAIFSGFSGWSRPFVSKVSDSMDVSGRITAFLTVLFGLIGSPAVSSRASGTMGNLINAANAINAVVLVWGSLYGIRAVRQWYRGVMGVLRFSNTVDDRSGTFDRIVRGPKVGPGWDLRLETKHRIWHAFWRSLLTKGYKDKSARLGERLAELERITADVGRYKIVDHFLALLYPGRGALRQWISDELEGVDVFWDGVSHDGHLDSRTGFGKMYIKAYPFHCVMVYDDSDDYTFIYEKDLDALVARNTDPEIQRRRGVRKALRALEGELVYCPLDRMETHSVEDGTETYTDKDGHRKSRTRYSNVQVLMHYTNGRMGIGRASKGGEAAQGFSPVLHYSDGQGQARAPHTGQMKQIHGSCDMGAEALDITNEYRVFGKLEMILGHPNNSNIIQGKLPSVYAAERQYRRKVADDRDVREMLMSSAFWLHVFDSETIPRSALAYYFHNFEQNPDLRSLPEDHSDGLDYLYARMAFVRSHPGCAFWYVFWDDVWTCNNQSMGWSGKKANPELRKHLDPASPSAIAYRPMDRPELEALLSKLGVRSKRRKFTNEIIDGLYARILEIDAEFKQQLQDIASGAIPVPTVGTAISKPTVITVSSQSPSGGNGATLTVRLEASSATMAAAGQNSEPPAQQLQRRPSSGQHGRSSMGGVLSSIHPASLSLASVAPSPAPTSAYSHRGMNSMV